jgi:hypothetical protein
MEIQLIQGKFSTADAMEIITQMIHIKIKYHEKKIKSISNEEDIKMRENKIKKLQKDLYDFREYLNTKGKTINVKSVIEIE